jgi:hypothetical protein
MDRQMIYAGPLGLAILTACAGGPTQQDPSWKLIQITDVGMVVREWEGAVNKDNATRPEGSVRLMIRGNGTYLFAGQSSSKEAVGSGELVIRDGRLIGDTEHRLITVSLYDHKGKTVVYVEAKNTETGERYHGEFTKVQ